MIDWLINMAKKVVKPKPKAKKKAKPKTKRKPKPFFPPAKITARELRPGWQVFEIPTTCPAGGHAVKVIREGLVVRAIDTPCGIAAARAEYNLGADNCWRFIEWVQQFLKGMFSSASVPQSMKLADINFISSEIGKALGGEEGENTRQNLRAERYRSRDYEPWDRSELTKTAALAFVARIAGPGTQVVLDRKSGIKVTIQYAGRPPNEWSTYHHIAGSWGVGSGPQAPDAVYKALQRIGPHIL